ncbi:MAG: hypothetical protein OEZ39_20480 [Gammaproteobacteria bacterium]|nr:hypothetical protein [Gammaproteobacteria bacterium]
MDIIILIFIIIPVLFFFYQIVRESTIQKRETFINWYEIPNKVQANIISTYPHLSEDDTKKVIRALKEYFLICNMAKLRMISMPSQVVDVAWHEFILFTREYQEFCHQAFGRFLHHTPAEAMQSRTVAQDGMKRAWRLSCKREGMDPQTAPRLPVLFSIDSDLNIPDGFKYSLNCTDIDDKYCVGHIGCGGGCAGDGDAGGDGGGCGGGCGGD